MTECYVLIDYENVQPPSLDPLASDLCHILVFTGVRQTKLPTGFVTSMQRFGARAEYVQLTASGKNLMDFHVAYYLGTLTARNPTARFCVIAKDKGYDRLIEHLKQRGIDCRRCVDVREFKVVGGATATAPKSKTHSVKVLADRVVENLQKRKQAKPATVRTLTNTIKRVLGDIPDRDLKNVLNTLKQRGVIKVAGDKVTYQEGL